MGTTKRQRQKANRAQRQFEEQRAARSDTVKRNALRWAAVVVAAMAGVLLIAWIGGAFDGGDDDKTPASTLPITLPEISVASTLASSTVDSTVDSTPVSTMAGTLPATDATTVAPTSTTAP